MHSFLSLVLAASMATALPSSLMKRTNGTASSNTSTSTTSGDGTADNNQALIDSLILAPTAVDRLALIPNDADFVYDFQNPPTKSAITSGDGGRTVRADRKTYPPLVGTGVSMTLGFLGPCGFNTPHTHPRSSEINVVVQGRLSAEFFLENRARTVYTNLSTFDMTVFPRGAIHTEFNPDCTDAVFVAGFADEDPGVQQTAQGFFGLSNNVVSVVLGADGEATVNGLDLDKFRSVLPANVALGVQECLQKCGLSRGLKAPK